MLHLSSSRTYHFYNAPTDMRRGFDSLSGLVIQFMQLNVLSGSIFIFINKKRTQVKLLLWEGDGFALYNKRFIKGTYEQPTLAGNNFSITAQQLQLILQGIQLWSIKLKKRFPNASLWKIGGLFTFFIRGNINNFYTLIFLQLIQPCDRRLLLR